MANGDANVLNVLAEAKNGDICQYNLVYLEKNASFLLVQHCVTNFWKKKEKKKEKKKKMLVSSGARYDMPDHKM